MCLVYSIVIMYVCDRSQQRQNVGFTTIAMRPCLCVARLQVVIKKQKLNTFTRTNVFRIFPQLGQMKLAAIVTESL